MQTPTQEFVTPVAKAKLVIKDWITGREAEAIEEALYGGIDAKPTSTGAAFGKFDTKALTEQAHCEIEKFIVSVDGSAEKVVEAVTSLPEEDYEAVRTEIAKRRKKKVIPAVG